MWLRIVLFLVVASVFLVPQIVLLHTAGHPVFYLLEKTPPGQGLYVLSKSVALAAFGLIWFQCVTALIKKELESFGVLCASFSRHRRIGLISFGLVATHVLLFFAAASLRAGHLAFDVFVPSFNHGFYKFYVSVGVVAFLLLLMVITAGVARLRYRHIVASWLHKISFASFFLIFLHGLQIGTETRLGVMSYLYYFLLLSVVSCLAYKSLSAICAWAAGHQKNMARYDA